MHTLLQEGEESDARQQAEDEHGGSDGKLGSFGGVIDPK